MENLWSSSFSSEISSLFIIHSVKLFIDKNTNEIFAQKRFANHFSIGQYGGKYYRRIIDKLPIGNWSCIIDKFPNIITDIQIMSMNSSSYIKIVHHSLLFSKKNWPILPMESSIKILCTSILQ
jgi:hypothetical protein